MLIPPKERNTKINHLTKAFITPFSYSVMASKQCGEANFRIVRHSSKERYLILYWVTHYIPHFNDLVILSLGGSSSLHVFRTFLLVRLIDFSQNVPQNRDW
jgi:hypothetical protein